MRVAYLQCLRLQYCNGCHSALHSSVYNRVTVFPVDHGIDSTKDPYFPNVACEFNSKNFQLFILFDFVSIISVATFKVIVPNKCVALNSYNYWLQTKYAHLLSSIAIQYPRCPS